MDPSPDTGIPAVFSFSSVSGNSVFSSSAVFEVSAVSSGSAILSGLAFSARSPSALLSVSLLMDSKISSSSAAGSSNGISGRLDKTDTFGFFSQAFVSLFFSSGNISSSSKALSPWLINTSSSSWIPAGTASSLNGTRSTSFIASSPDRPSLLWSSLEDSGFSTGLPPIVIFPLKISAGSGCILPVSDGT